jgi:hypothetical protein
MPFDPTKPATGSSASSAEMRAQLAALKALIDAVPAGPPGPAGPEGPVISSIQIGSVTTVDPSTPASVSVSTNGNSVELSFSIPKGETGPGISFDDMTNAITTATAGTARNPTLVGDLVLTPSAQPTQGELQSVIDKVNELLVALRR